MQVIDGVRGLDSVTRVTAMPCNKCDDRVVSVQRDDGAEL